MISHLRKKRVQKIISNEDPSPILRHSPMSFSPSQLQKNENLKGIFKLQKEGCNSLQFADEKEHLDSSPKVKGKG